MKWPEMANNNGTTFQMTTLIGDNNNFVIVIGVQQSTVVYTVQLDNVKCEQ